MNRSKINTRQRRNKAFSLLNQPLPVTIPEAPVKPEFQDTYTQMGYPVNHGLQYEEPLEDTMDRELNSISASDVPVPGGSYITDYDGIQLTISKLSMAFMNARSRLEWAGHTISTQEKALYEKERLLADIQGIKTPPRPPKAPFFTEPTNAGEIIMVTREVANRFGMIAVGTAAGSFFLFFLWKLFF